MFCHKNCCDLIETECPVSENYVFPTDNLRHNFVINKNKKWNYCDHCGYKINLYIEKFIKCKCFLIYFIKIIIDCEVIIHPYCISYANNYCTIYNVNKFGILQLKIVNEINFNEDSYICLYCKFIKCLKN